jgi:hypothetical protein
MRSLSARTAIGVILLAGTAGTLQATAAGNGPVVIGFERAPFPYIVIRVPVTGHGCAAMLFDTGTNTTVLDPRLAAGVGLVAGRETTVESLGGSSRAVAGQVRGIGFGDAASMWRLAVAAPLVGVREISSSIRGIFGHDWLARTDYIIDYEARRIVIGPAGTVPRPAGGQQIALTWVSGRPAIAVTIRAQDGAPLTARLVLDSGADGVALFGRAARIVASRGGTRTTRIDSGFGAREVPASQISCTIDGRTHSVTAQIRSDLTDREEDGLLPTSLFRSVYVAAADGVVVLEGVISSDSQLRNDEPCRGGPGGDR